MANPNPQHNPTDGLGVAAYVKLSGGLYGSVLTSPSAGTTVHPGSVPAPGAVPPANGQGIGATAGGVYPVAQYAITLSATAGGRLTYENIAILTASLVDVRNNSYTPVGNFVAKSYNNPSAGSPAWYKPSNFAGYSADVVSASVDSYGVITLTGLNPGQAIVEVQFPTFDNTNGDNSNSGNPVDMIYVQIVVTVIP